MADMKQVGQLQRDDSYFPVGWKHSNLTASTGTGATIIKASPCVLHTITFNDSTATTVTLYDSASTMTGTIGIITIPASSQLLTLTYDIFLTSGLTVSVGTASNIIISYI